MKFKRVAQVEHAKTYICIILMVNDTCDNLISDKVYTDQVIFFINMLMINWNGYSCLKNVHDIVYTPNNVLATRLIIGGL